MENGLEWGKEWKLKEHIKSSCSNPEENNKNINSRYNSEDESIEISNYLDIKRRMIKKKMSGQSSGLNLNNYVNKLLFTKRGRLGK